MVQLPYTAPPVWTFDADGNKVESVRTQYDDRVETQRTTYDDNDQPIKTEHETEFTLPGVDGSAHITTVTDSEDLRTGERTHEVEQEVQQPHGPGDEDFPTHRDTQSTTTDASGQTIDTTHEIFDRDAQGNTQRVNSETDTTGVTTVVSTKLTADGDGVQVTDILDAAGHLVTQDDDVIGNPDLDSPFFSTDPFGGLDGTDPDGRGTDPGDTGPESGQTGDLVAVVVGGGDETGDEGESGETGDLVAVVVGGGDETGDEGESGRLGDSGELGETGIDTGETRGFGEAQTVGDRLGLDRDLDR